MQLTSLSPPTQAFSYLTSKDKSSTLQNQWIRHGLTIMILLLIAGTSIYVQFPTPWVKYHITSNPWFFYPILAMFLAAKAFFMIESGGYLIHRYFEHVGFMTRRSNFVREGQRHHWAHHMIIYPLNKQYIKGYRYIDSQNYGLPWQWILPLFIVIVLSFYIMGWKVETLVFVAMAMGYAKINEFVHARFHILGHPLINNRYFQWLADIHILHHFDQETNFTITNPLMDIICGTYLSPKGDFQKLKALMKSNDLNSADFVNWYYLLIEATPAIYAQSIAAVQKFPGVLKKAKAMLVLLEQFQPTDFYFERAQQMRSKLIEFLQTSQAPLS